jgi:hemerythrin-like domain-containing protein
MLRYLREFPLVLHHPKEERYLHRLLRERARDAGPLLAELEAQHAREHELVDRAMKCAEQADAGDEVALVELGTRIETLAIAIWGHMTLEESKVLPLAREKLLPGDWLEVAEAFEGNGDPDFAALQTEEFRRYFTRLTNLLPAGPSIA